MGDEIVIHKHLAQMSSVVLPGCKCHLHRGGSAGSCGSGVGDVLLPALPRTKPPAPGSSRGLFAEGQEVGAPRAGAPRGVVAGQALPSGAAMNPQAPAACGGLLSLSAQRHGSTARCFMYSRKHLH